MTDDFRRIFDNVRDALDENARLHGELAACVVAEAMVRSALVFIKDTEGRRQALEVIGVALDDVTTAQERRAYQ